MCYIDQFDNLYNHQFFWKVKFHGDISSFQGSFILFLLSLFTPNLWAVLVYIGITFKLDAM